MKVVIPLILALAVGAWFAYPRLKDRFGSEQGAAEMVSGVGTVEATQVEIAPKLAGYIVEVTFDAGSKVRAGEILARIDRPDLPEQLAADRATLARARALLIDLEKGPRVDEIAASAATMAAARSVFDKASSELDRYKALFASGAATRETLDSYQNSYNTAESTLAAAEANHRLLLAGARPDLIDAQRQDVQRAEAALRLTQTQVDDTVVRSPMGGVILSRNLEKGDFVAVGQSIASLANLSDSWVRIYVPSPQLGLIRLGQPAEIYVDAYPGRAFPAHVKEIRQQAEFTPRQTLTRHDRANTVYAVKVQIETGEDILKPGMPVEARLR